MLALILAVLIPVQVNYAVRLNTPEASGWGVPVSPNTILTVAHVANRDLIQYCLGDGALERCAIAKVLWKDTVRDLAILTIDSEQPFLGPVRISQKQLVMGQKVFWRTYLGDQSHYGLVTGTYLGTDNDGDLALDAFVTWGQSGSPVLDESGELIGLIHMAFNPAITGCTNRAQDSLSLKFSCLSHFSPLSYAIPITKMPTRPE